MRFLLWEDFGIGRGDEHVGGELYVVPQKQVLTEFSARADASVERYFDDQEDGKSEPDTESESDGESLKAKGEENAAGPSVERPYMEFDFIVM